MSAVKKRDIRDRLRLADAMASCALFLDEAKEELAGMASSGMTGPSVIH